ncbi:MAG TPA: response regulator transcription factor [Clostridia bacterium]|nr:response regulator transcription factor [Clostridia bacterium]
MYKVFIADDDPYILEGIRHILRWEEFGIEIIGTASNGFEALEALKKHPADILITDIKMPKMDGLELIKRVRDTNPAARFIILSGYDDFEYLKESIKLGIENYILKPINSEELEKTITSTLDKISKDKSERLKHIKDMGIIRNNILYRWVTNTISESEFEERTGILDIDFGKPPYVVCTLRLLSQTGNQLLFAHAEKIFTEKMSVSGFATVFCTPDGIIIIILSSGGSSSKKSFYEKVVQECLQELGLMKIDYFFTWGSIENDYWLIQRSYLNAFELQQYSIILPKNSILDYNLIQKNPEKDKLDDLISINEISRFIRSKDKNALYLYIDKIFTCIKSFEGVTPSMLKNLSVELLFSITNCTRIISLGKKSLINELDFSFTDLNKMQSIEDITDFIKAASSKLIDLTSEKYEKMSPLVRRLIHYISEHYSDDISLKTLSLQLNTNPNYLGKLFKDETSEYFSDYVNRIRIEKAKELLLCPANMTKDIAVQVGYNDVNYFYRAFKKYAEMAPSEFRDLYCKL